MLSCPLEADDQVRLRTAKDYGDITQFLHEECQLAIHSSSTHDARLTRRECLRRLAVFFGSDHEVYVMAFQGEGESVSGNWVLCDGCISSDDVMRVWRNTRFLSSSPGRLFAITDCCHSGYWVSACAELQLQGMAIQAACSAKRKTKDSYTESFTQMWLKVQRGECVQDVMSSIALSKWRKPQFYISDGMPPLHLGRHEVRFFLEGVSAHHGILARSAVHLAPTVQKNNASGFLSDGSQLLWLHAETMDCMSGFQCSSLSECEAKVASLRAGRKSDVYEGLLFHLQSYYMLGTHLCVWPSDAKTTGQS